MPPAVAATSAAAVLAVIVAMPDFLQIGLEDGKLLGSPSLSALALQEEIGKQSLDPEFQLPNAKSQVVNRRP